MVSKFQERVKNPFFIAALLICVFVYGGFFKVRNRHPFKSLLPLEAVSEVWGNVCANPSKTSGGKFYFVQLNLEKATGILSERKIVSSSSGLLNCLVPCDIVESLYPGKLFSITNEKIVFETGEKIRLSGSISSGIFMCRRAEYLGFDNSFAGKLRHSRAVCRLNFKRLMYGWKQAGGFILALISGSREYTESSLAENFRRAGLSHILALSGMHLSFFSSLAGGSSKKVFGKKYSTVFRIFGILFFVWFAGLSPSLFRALLCSMIMLFCSIVFAKDVDFFLVLCSVFLIHSVVFPGDMFSAAFILSYGALAGILLFSDFFRNFLCRKVPLKISDPLSASIGAQISTCPVSIFLFGVFMPVGIVATLAVSPMVSFFLAFAVLSIVLCFCIPFLAPLFGCILNFIYKLISLVTGLFALVPPLSFSGEN